MYGALWRALPGPWWLRLFILLVFIVALVYALVFWVFPWVNTLLPQLDVTVDNQ